MLCILNIGAVPRLYILNLGTVLTFRHSLFLHQNVLKIKQSCFNNFKIYQELLLLLNTTGNMEVFLPLSTILVNKLDGVVGKAYMCLVS